MDRADARVGSFRRLALIATCVTYFLIFLGGLVRVTGAGLGCPDWPHCFGRWAPPIHISQLPPDLDPRLFNFALAWIEYVNRLVGVADGLVILLTAIFAIAWMRQHRAVLYSTIAAALLVAYQGWQGGQVVSSELEPLLVSVHMGLALIIVSLLIYATLRAYYLEKPDAIAGLHVPRSIGSHVGLLWAVALVQIILGTRFRETLEYLAERFPLASDLDLLGRADVINASHTIVGVLLAVGSWHVAMRMLKGATGLPPFLRQAIWVMIGLMGVQVLIGVVLVTVGLPALLQVFHLWTASLFIGILLILFTAVRRAEANR